MSLASASGAAILRAAQKDEYFTKKLAGNASEVLRLFGNSAMKKYTNYVYDASQIIYGSLTTLKDLQTLGEEYTAIIQVDNTYVKLPAKWYRAISILMSTCGESIVKRALNKIKSDINANNDLLPSAKRMLLKSIIITQWLVPLIKDIHRAWFYLGGQHYSISKRLTCINYVNTIPSDTFYTTMLRPLGIPCLLKVILQSIRYPPSFDDIDVKESSLNLTNKTPCNSCLESNLTPCALPCGHIFCNKCARECYICAICRTSYHPNRTVPLQNFKYE